MSKSLIFTRNVPTGKFTHNLKLQTAEKQLILSDYRFRYVRKMRPFVDSLA